jgi:hypothetical protein
MELVGYKLVDLNDNVLQTWGGVWGQCPGIPNPIECPNGDVVYGPEINVEYSGVKLILWMMDQPPTPIPQQVPIWAVRTVLQNDNLFDQVQTAINASTDNALKNVWEYGNYANRDSTAINTIAYTLGLTEAQVDQMFIDANNLSV